MIEDILAAISVADAMAVVAGVGAIWAAVKWVKPVLTSMGDFFRDWSGEDARPGVEHRPGVMEQLSELRTDVDMAKTLARDAAESAADASYHSKPNHGGSAYDALMRRVDGLEQANAKTVQVVEDALGEHARIQERSDEQSEIIRAVVARLEPNKEN